MTHRMVPGWGWLLLAVQACTGATEGDRPPVETGPEAFLSVAELSNLAISPDGQFALLTSTASGQPQPVIVNLATGAARPAVSASRPMHGVGWTPDGERVLLSADQDGDERHHLLLAPVGGTPIDLTPGDDRRARFLGWSADGTSLYLSDNARDPRYADIHSLHLETREQHLLYRDSLGLEFGAISADGSLVALYRPSSQIGGVIWLARTGSGRVEPVEAGGVGLEGLPLAFTPDRTGLLLAAGSGRDFDRLEHLDLRSMSTTPWFEPEWDVTDATPAGEDRWLVSVNEDAHTRLYMRSGEGAVQRVPVPDSLSVTESAFDTSSSRLVFLATTGRRPAELYLLDREGGVERRPAHRNGPGHVDGVRPELVRFPSTDGVEIPGLLYRPPGEVPATGRAVVLRAHGGPGGQARVRYSAEIQYLVAGGYAVLEVNNRGSTGYGDAFWHLDDGRHGEADLEDYVAAKRWLAAAEWADTSRVAIMGSSYGGYLVLAALAFRPDVFAAGVDLFGISDWVRTIQNIPPWWEPFRPALEAEMGPFEDVEFFRAKSPLHHARRIRRPLIVLQGANDPRVLQRESDAIVEAVRASGVPVEYVLFEDEGHGFSRRENRVRALAEIRDFLDRHLGPTGPRQP